MIASIQKIRNLRSHPNADALELCDVLGWQVVVKKGEFKDGELVVYVEIDSVLPDRPEFEFLRNKHFRIKPIKLRGESSNGICFPLSILPPETAVNWLQEGFDVAETIGATHYEKPVPAQLSGRVVGNRPSFISKTDELNLRSYPHMVESMKGLSYYITVKSDGSSGTFFVKDGEFGVCSRNLQLQEDENNGFWKMARKYNIEKILKELGKNVVLQAEVVGPGVNGNNLGLSEMDLHIFNYIDLFNRRLFSFEDMKTFSETYHIPMVKIIDEGDNFEYEVHELISLANSQKYPNNKPAEGIVIRPKVHTPYYTEKVAWGALSGKIINENYKEKE